MRGSSCTHTTSVASPYADVDDLVWVQEEPRNMGAWSHVERCLRAVVGGREVRYVGRPERASPAEGYATDHETEQERIVSEALAGTPKARRAAGRRKSRQSGD